ncbi:MAG: hypothetical protein Q9221_005684 [Calogaya cf. arnoldii]
MTEEGYFTYFINIGVAKAEAATAEATPSDAEFWRAAYDFDPLAGPDSSKTRGTYRDRKAVWSDNAEAHPRDRGSFGGSAEDRTSLNFAATDSGAIYYPDDHPTAEIISAQAAQSAQLPESPSAKRPVTSRQKSHPTAAGSFRYPSPGISASDQHLRKRHSRELTSSKINALPQRTPSPQQQAPSSPRNVVTPAYGPQRDDKLRRIAALGWVIMQDPAGDWKRTGHVLVIDMDDRAIRLRQPWLILAPEWPSDGEETVDGTYTHRAAEVVARGDKSVAGVFPGDRNRTPICCIRPQIPIPSGQSVLRYFGPNFSFNPIRLGGRRPSRPSDNGPGLARAMEWYWDPVAKQEVCYIKDRHESRRLFGELQEEPTLEVEGSRLELRALLNEKQKNENQNGEGRRAIHDTMGFLD